MKLNGLFALACACLLSTALACTTQNGGGGANGNSTAGGNNTAGTPGGGAGGGVKRLAFVTNNASDFWTIARKGVEKADAELADVTAEFKIPSDGTAAEQKRIVDDLLAKGIDGIAISPVDPDNQTGLINDVSKQTLVFTQDSDAPKSERACYVGTDNVAAGRQAGRARSRRRCRRAARSWSSSASSTRATRRSACRASRRRSKARTSQIIDMRTDDTDRVRAKANVADALVKYP